MRASCAWRRRSATSSRRTAVARSVDVVGSPSPCRFELEPGSSEEAPSDASRRFASESIAVESEASARPPAQLRIAFSPRLGLDVPVDRDVADAIAAAIERLRSAGWPIVEHDPVWPAGLTETSFTALQSGGLAALHGAAFARDPAQFDPDIAAQIQRGLGLRAADVAAALEASAVVKRATAAFFADFDLLLCPTAPCVAWSVDRLGPERIGGVPVEARGHAVFTPFFNHALTPALSLPCGTGRDNLPVGLQMIARRGADWLLLRSAASAGRLLS